jgi:cyclase
MARGLRRPSAAPADPESAPMQSYARKAENRRREADMLGVRIAVVATMMALSGPSFAQQPAASPPAPVDYSKVEIRTTDLGNNCYMLEGWGGNITVAVAADGIIMVDGEYAPLHDKIKAAIEAISKQPIKYLINTHFHGDHTGGNEAFAKDGVTIVSQVNVSTRLAAGTTNGLTGAKTPPAPQAALPSDTYTNFSKIRLQGRVADLKHIANAHTDGDTYVWFKTANVLSTGDTFTSGNYPYIDFANGGNIKGMIAATDAYLRLTNAKTRIVPGHGPLADKAALMEYRTMLITARDRMANLVKEGKSEDDVVAMKPFADLDAKWAGSELASKNFIRVVYHSLADKPPDTQRPLLKRIFRRS